MATQQITGENFNDIVSNNDIVIIDFWAEWCGPCKSFAPIFEKVSEQYPDIVFGKLDTEAEQELAGYFQVRSIPTTIILKEGIAVFMQPGVMPEEAFAELIPQVQALDMDEVRKEIAEQEAKEK
jgi:thioredoxin 1